MAKKVLPKKDHNKIALIIALVLLGIIILGSIITKPSKEAEANEEVRSTLPGWSAGYRYWYDMDENEKSKLRLFGKYKQRSGDTFKIGWDRQVGKDLNQFELNPDDDGVIFFEQEIKF
jgi:hypothetical protein